MDDSSIFWKLLVKTGQVWQGSGMWIRPWLWQRNWEVFIPCQLAADTWERERGGCVGVGWGEGHPVMTFVSSWSDIIGSQIPWAIVNPEESLSLFPFAVLDSQGCYNKWSTEWLKSPEIYPLIVIEVRTLESRCCPGWFSLGGSPFPCLPDSQSLTIVFNVPYTTFSLRVWEFCLLLPPPASLTLGLGLTYCCSAPASSQAW